MYVNTLVINSFMEILSHTIKLKDTHMGLNLHCILYNQYFGSIFKN